MLKLNFNLRHQAITLLNPGTIVATDSKNYLVANFNFISNDWEYPLTAVFTSDVEKIPYTILVGQSEELEENECFIPWEVLQSSGNVYVSVFCGDLHTTNAVKFKVVKSGYTEGEIPPPPTPTIYEQILQALDSKQPMLTAGQNITISDDNVISAESGGVTSYKDLTDKPKISGADGSGHVPKCDLIKSLDFNTDGFLVSGYSDGSIRVSLSNYIFRTKYINEYDFNYLNLLQIGTFTSVIDEEGSALVINFPEELDINREKVYYISHYCIGRSGYSFIRKISGISELGEYKEYAQFIALAWDSQANAYKVFEETPWLDISSGGAQIVSGVVNANGTITFTDSDGNTFTTTGSSVIGADGFSPVATVTQTASGATVSITDSTGTTTANISNGQDGNDYVLTAQDKSDIADIVLGELPNADTMSF